MSENAIMTSCRSMQGKTILQ